MQAGPGGALEVWAVTDYPAAAACPACGMISGRIHETVLARPLDEQTGEYTLLADRWHTCFFDLDGQQGMLGQVQGRTADDAAYWLAGATRLAGRGPGGLHRPVHHLRLGGPPDAAARGAHRRPVPRGAAAVKATGDVRRRVARARYGRRGRSSDPEYGIKNLLVRNLEHLSAAQFAKIIDTLERDRYGQEIAAAWIAKEKLRVALNLRARVTGSVPCERQVRDRLFAFYDWCAQHDDIPELITLARTISRWEDEIIAAVITGSPTPPPKA